MVYHHRCHVYLALLSLLARTIAAAAWRPGLLLSSRLGVVRLRNPNDGRNAGSKIKKGYRGLKSNLAEDDVVDGVAVPPGVSEKRLIEVSSEIELPFSPEIAYDAYSDLTRQPSWSSWLHSVEYTDEAKEATKWTMKFFGVRYSWTAVSLKKERPFLIQWQSTSGLKNFGSVRFVGQKDEQNRTRMILRMTFVAPRAAAVVFRKSKTVAKFVKTNMIEESLLNFRKIVSETDAGSGETRD